MTLSVGCAFIIMYRANHVEAGISVSPSTRYALSTIDPSYSCRTVDYGLFFVQLLDLSRTCTSSAATNRDYVKRLKESWIALSVKGAFHSARSSIQRALCQNIRHYKCERCNVLQRHRYTEHTGKLFAI